MNLDSLFLSTHQKPPSLYGCVAFSFGPVWNSLPFYGKAKQNIRYKTLANNTLIIWYVDGFGKANSLKMEPIFSPKIFLVDDDPFSLSLAEQHILNLGYTDITSFTNGTDCLNNLTQKPDVIFLDHTMDILTGFEVLIKVKRFDLNIHVVIRSGQENLRLAVEAMKHGAFDYIIKGDREFECIEEVMKRIAQLQDQCYLQAHWQWALVRKHIAIWN